MKNLLPPISEKIRSREDTSIANWNPAQADPKTATISKCLQSEFTVRYEELKKFKENVLGKSAPNYVRPEVLRSIGPSPISEEARGEYEDPLIDFKPPVNNSIKARMARAAALESSYHLVVKLQSRMPVAMDLFIQGKNSILTTQLFPFRDFLRELGGSGAGADYASNPKNLLNVYFTTQTLSTVTTTSRQEIRDFKFRSDERIGMEVEYLNDRLICSKVIPDTQAAGHTLLLDSAIIIAINNRRVLNLEEFQDAMRDAKRGREMVFTVAVYKGGKSKVDELYTLNSNKNQQVKNLLSNMFGGGLKNASSVNDLSSQTASSIDEDDDLDSYTDGGKSVDEELPEPVVQSDAEAKLISDIQLDSADAKYDFKHLDMDDKVEDKNDLSYDDEEEMIAPKKKVVRDDKEIFEKEISYETENKDEEENKVEDEPLPATQDEESADDDDKSAVSHDSNDSWNYMTKIEDQVFPFSSIVCMPPELKASSCWGDPRKYIQFSNFSISWKLEVYWVDEDSALITRGEVKTGTSHFELCSTDHVWAIIATPIKGGKSQASVAASKFSSNESLSHASATSSIFESPPTLLIIKPSIASLREGKCASMLWSPWCSLSVTQTMYSQGGQRIDSHNPGVTRIQPGIHIQLFDSTKKEFIHDAQEANAVDVNLGKLSRRPLRKSRDVYRRKKTS